MDRRTALNRIGLLLGVAVSAPTMSAVLSGCSSPDDSYRPRFMSQAQYERFARIAELIIPTTDTPGAREAGVHGFVDTMLTEYYPRAEAQNFRSLFDAWAMLFDADNVDDAELERVLAIMNDKHEAGEPDELWLRFKEWTVTGYYLSEIGMTQELRTQPFGPARMDIPLEDRRTWAD